MSKWTQFWDMHSGGGQKADWAMIYIEAPEEDAKVIFYNRFGHNPERVTCTCCGEDYSISEGESIEQLTGYHRGCGYDKSEKRYLESESTDGYHGPYMTIEQYEESDGVLFIHAKDIKPVEKVGEVPEEGYVWR